MIGFIFFIIIMLVAFGLVGFITINKIKATDPNNINNSLNFEI